MSDLLAARSQMALTLAFHIVFAVIGVAMPLLMVIAERQWIRTRDETYRVLAKRWAKGTAILFAVGAVSGTVLSFELGLLWPQFMALAGPIVGMPFSMEGFAFFLEAIFLGIYLYGWDRISPTLHQIAGAGVALSGICSAAFVVCANAWMNTPAGFEMVDGVVVSIDPVAAMFNPASWTQMSHMVVASYAAVGFGVAGVHAYKLLREPGNLFHRHALGIAMAVGIPAAFMMPVTGHFSAEHVAEYQPAKFAAMEAHWETERGAAILIGGWADEENEETRFAIRIPYALSILAHMDPNAEVTGLSDIPRDERPPVNIVHIAFDLMVGIGMWMMALGAGFTFLAWRRRELPEIRPLLKLLVFTSPLGFLAIEAGWTVTEVGRQPWVIQGYMRTADAVTPMTGLIVPFTTFTILYLVLGVAVVLLLRRQVIASPTEAELAEAREVTHGN